MPRTSSKTIVTAVAGDKESLAAARLENLKKAREKALELRLLRSKPSVSSTGAGTSGVQNKTRKRIQAEPVSPQPIDENLVAKMAAPATQSGEITEPEQPTKPKRGRPRGSGKRKQPEMPDDSNNTPADTTGTDRRGQTEPKVSGEFLHGGLGEGDATVVTQTPAEAKSPRTPPENVSDVPTAQVPDTVEEGELDPSPPPPTELPRGRSKNNRRKPTTVQRRRTRPPSVDTVRRRLDFDRMHVPIGGGAFYRNHSSGHFTFSR
jgi:hypothetical protein